MYGTIARLRMKPGAEPLLRAQTEALRTDDRPGGKRMQGWVSTWLYRASRDPQELWLVVAFTDEAAYRANAALESQHQWYLRMRGCLEAEPEWIDGEVLAHLP